LGYGSRDPDYLSFLSKVRDLGVKGKAHISDYVRLYKQHENVNRKYYLALAALVAGGVSGIACFRS